MADNDEIQRRRALRRKRILDNSEDRLKKLTTSDRSIVREFEVVSNGKLHTTEDSSLSASLATSSASQQSETHVSQSRSPPDADSNHRHQLQQQQQQQQSARQRVHGNYDTDSDECSYSPMDEVSGRGSVRDNSRNVQTLPKILTENKPCFKPKVDSASRGSLTKSTGLLLPAHLIAWRKWLCVLFAILAQLAVHVLDERIVYKLVTVPIIALEIAISTIEAFSSLESQQQSLGMMSTALLLCGIKNAVGLVHWYNIIVRVLQDFAVYFFVFFVCHQSIEAIG